ncbi:MAG: helix-turn-helix transcriptional regulator [Ilumatobacteraceae bacterium]
MERGGRAGSGTHEVSGSANLSACSAVTISDGSGGAGLTQRQVATAVGIPVTVLSAYEATDASRRWTW